MIPNEPAGRSATHRRGGWGGLDVLAHGDLGELLAGGILEGDGDAVFLRILGCFIHAETWCEGRTRLHALGDLELTDDSEKAIHLGSLGGIVIALGDDPFSIF